MEQPQPQQPQQQQQQEVNMEEAWAAFRKGVASVFKQWMVLHLAVAHNWGGGDSHRKAVLLLEDVLGMFKPNPRAGLRPRRAPDQYEVEDKLGAYLDEQFETLVEDGSVEEVAELVASMWRQCALGDYTLARETVAREEQVLRQQNRFSEVSRSASQQAQAAQAGLDNEMDDSDSDGDGDAPANEEEEEELKPRARAVVAPAVAMGGGAEGGGGAEMEMETEEMEAQGDGGMAHQEGGPAAGALDEEDGWTTVRSSTKRKRRTPKPRGPQEPMLFF